MVVVGRALMVGTWSTFTDFLQAYLAERLGRQWVVDEMQRGTEGHPIGRWALLQKRSMPSESDSGGIRKGTINNALRSIMSIAYSLYLIEHHYEQYEEPLLERMINRLKVASGFEATISEVNTAAAFLKAGFLIKYENDLHPGQHAEFIATFPTTGRRFSVEVKTRAGPLDPKRPALDQIKLKNKLSQALKKNLPWARVVFVDINLPNLVPTEDGELDGLLAQIDDAELSLRIRHAPAPPAYLFVVNQPFHHNLEEYEAAAMTGAFGFRLPTFQPRTPTTKFRDIVLGREKHPEMHALIESIKIHGDPPATFDGQAPEFAFGKELQPRWIVGNSYVVPDANSNPVLAQLQSAIGNAGTKKMHGIFQANGKSFTVTCPMTDAEAAVYRRSPETFFGVVQSVSRQAKTAYELAEFFYASYKDSPKEKLIEFLKDHPAIENLKTWPQKDLAVFVCEQWALAAEANSSVRTDTNGSQ